SGFSLSVNSLTPGQSYRIVVFAMSAISGQFGGNKTVNVTVAAGSPPATPPPSDPNPNPPADPGAPPPGCGGPTANTRVTVNRTTWYLGGTNNGYVLSGTETAVITFTQGSSTWTVTSDQPWLTVSPASGNGNGTVNVSVNAGSYPNGTAKTATLTITAPGVPN